MYRFNFAELAIEVADSTTNPLLDENGQFVKADEAVRNFASLWKEWDLVNKFMSKLPSIIIAVAIIVFGMWISKKIGKIIVKAMKTKNVDYTVYQFISNMVVVVLRIVFILSALSMFIKVTSLLAAFSAVGVAIGLGLQDSVAQFASGVQILLNHPFKTGDYVEVAGIAGNVAEIRFMNTIITTVDNKRVIIPNSDLTKNHITNYSAEENRRVDLTFSISYSTDISKAKAVILEVAKANQFILDDPATVVYVGSHEASSIDLITRCWCKSADYWEVYFAMQEAVKVAFDKNEIEIPFSQLDVHIIDKK